MSNQSHTPGPWVLYGSHEQHVMGGNGARHIALIVESPEFKANRSLIAAAPDMLIMLEALEAVLSEHKDNPGTWAEVTWRQVKQVIAKAKGQS